MSVTDWVWMKKKIICSTTFFLKKKEERKQRRKKNEMKLRMAEQKKGRTSHIISVIIMYVYLVCGCCAVFPS